MDVGRELEPGNGIDERAADRRRHIVLVVDAVLILVAVTAGVGWSIVHPDDGRAPGHVDVRALAIIAGVVVVMLGVQLVVLNRVLRSTHLRKTMSYPMNSRSRVAKSLLKGRPLEDEDLPLAEAIVGAQRFRPRTIALHAALVVCTLVIGIVFPHGGIRWLMVGAALCEALGFGLLYWQRYRLIRGYRAATAGRRAPENPGSV